MIFISYRREDSIGHTGRLYDRLVQQYGKETVFMDIDAMEPGEDFVDAIQRRVAGCDVEIVVIGKAWTNMVSPNGVRRLDDPEDFVRLEIQAAIDRNVRIIPVLVGGASMPGSRDMPDVLVPLVARPSL